MSREGIPVEVPVFMRKARRYDSPWLAGLMHSTLQSYVTSDQVLLAAMHLAPQMFRLEEQDTCPTLPHEEAFSLPQL